jgi:hypothetical protein
MVVSAGQNPEYFVDDINIFVGYFIIYSPVDHVHDLRRADCFFAGLYCALDCRSLRISAHMADRNLFAEPHEIR